MKITFYINLYFGKSLQLTLQRIRRSGSVTDLTFVTSSLSPLSTWRLCSYYTASDHEALVFSIGERNTRPLSQSTRMQAFKAETLRIPNFLDAMGNLSVSCSAQQMATNLSNHTLHACNISMSWRKALGYAFGSILATCMRKHQVQAGRCSVCY